MSARGLVADLSLPRRLTARSRAGLRGWEILAFVALLAVSAVDRTAHLGVHFWIDEGIAVGISAHPLTAIPHLLLQDGSPPLYYFLLHLWMAAFGESEAATHGLSLLFALLAVPAALWLGRRLLGARAGWLLAGLVALDPFLTHYAQETRMYSLLVLLSLLATGAFVAAFVDRHRRAWPAFGLVAAVMLYTHNWALVYLGGAAVVLAWLWWRSDDRRALALDAGRAYGLAAVLYAPWVPSLIFQAQHTGAPWAVPPSVVDLVEAPGVLLGGVAGTIVVLLGAGSGWAATASGRPARERTAVLLALFVVPVLAAWLAAQVVPLWTTRYLAVVLGPGLMAVAVGLARARNLGLVAAALLVALWAGYTGPGAKSNAHYVATTLGQDMAPGTTVISTQPAQVAVLSYYLPPGMRYATEWGSVADPGVVDWRNGTARLAATSVAKDLDPLIARTPPGHQILLVAPIQSHAWPREATWSRLVFARSSAWELAMLGDPRLRLERVLPNHWGSPGPNPVQGFLFRRVIPRRST